MRKRIFIVFFILVLMSSLNVRALEIEGAELPETLDAGNERLILNGAGVRSKFFMDLYVAGLYLKQKTEDPEKIVASEETMAIRLHIVSSLITSEKMEKATREGFFNATGGKIGPIAEQIDRFIAVFRQEIKENDIFDLVYAPGGGVKVYKNGVHRDSIQGLDFKKAMFGIWLGEKPAQKSLKQSMLGKGGK